MKKLAIITGIIAIGLAFPAAAETKMTAPGTAAAATNVSTQATPDQMKAEHKEQWDQMKARH